MTRGQSEPRSRGRSATKGETPSTRGRGQKARAQKQTTAQGRDQAAQGPARSAARGQKRAAGQGQPVAGGQRRSGRGRVKGQQDAQPVSLAAAAYRAIRDRLVMLDLPPGAPINDEVLARDLGMGRTPVREALKRLETERLVVTYPRRGTFATEVNITDLAHIFEVRQHLEPAAAASAAAHATATDKAELQQLIEELDADHALDAPEPLMGLDMRVHRAIYTATHNPYFEDTLILYDNLATRIWCLFLDRLPDLAGHVGDHTPLLLAVVDGDANKAADLARGHVVRFEQAIRSVI